MFDSELGGQISWLLPVAIVGSHGRSLADAPPPAQRSPACRVRAVGRHAPDVPGGVRRRQGDLPSVLHGGDGPGGGRARRRRRGGALAPRATVAPLGLGLPATVVGTVLWADTLLARTSGYDSWLGPTVVVTGVVSALVLFLCLARRGRRAGSRLAAGTVAAASVLAGPGGVLADDARHHHERHRHRRAHLRCGRPRRRGGPVVWASRAGRATAAPTGTHTGGPPGGGTVRAGAVHGVAHRGQAAVAVAGGGASTANEALVRYLERHQGSADVPGRGERIADSRTLHPRERQGRDRHGWFRRDGPGTDTQRVQASRGDGQGALRVRLERRGKRRWHCWRRRRWRDLSGGAGTGSTARTASTARTGPDARPARGRDAERGSAAPAVAARRRRPAPSTAGSRSTARWCRRAPTAAARVVEPCTTSAARRPQ